MIKEIKLDIFNSDWEVLIHQTNCWNTMGTGIAKVIKEKYPQVYEADQNTARGDKSKLGTILPVWIDHNKCIINCYGQYRYGREKRQTNYEAYYRCLEKVKEFMITEKLNKLSIYKFMGCSNSGGNWNICYTMIKEVLDNSEIDVTICEL